MPQPNKTQQSRVYTPLLWGHIGVYASQITDYSIVCSKAYSNFSRTTKRASNLNNEYICNIKTMFKNQLGNITLIHSSIDVDERKKNV